MFQVLRVKSHATLHSKEEKKAEVSEKVRNKNVTKWERSRLHVYPQRPSSSCFHNMQYYQETWHCGQKRKLDRSQQQNIALLLERQSLNLLLHRFKLTICASLLNTDNSITADGGSRRETHKHMIYFLQDHTWRSQSCSSSENTTFLPPTWRRSSVAFGREIIKLLKHFINQCSTY